MLPRRVLYVVLAFALMTTLAGCGSGEADAPELNLRPGEASSGLSEAATSATDATDSVNPKSPDTATPAGTGGQPVGGPSPGSSGSGSTESKAGQKDSTKPSTAAKIIRINWWNDTQANPVDDPAIVFAGTTVRPKPGKSSVLSIGPCPVGKKLQLVVYPDGPSGQKMVATFLVTSAMVANSDQDAIHVEVRDNRVRVLGSPIPNFDQTFERAQ